MPSRVTLPNTKGEVASCGSRGGCPLVSQIYERPQRRTVILVASSRTRSLSLRHVDPI